MEEAVTKKFVHEESEHLLRLSGWYTLDIFVFEDISKTVK